MADGKNKPKPSGAFYRKRKIEKAKENEKQSLNLKKFFCSSQSTSTAVQELDTNLVFADLTGKEPSGCSSHQTAPPVPVSICIGCYYILAIVCV